MTPSELLLLKLTATPLMMLVVSLAARRWGGFVGGIISGLPITSAPVMFFLAIEQGAPFAEQAASAALSGLGAVLLTYFFYLIVTKRTSIPVACFAALVFFAACSQLTIRPFFSDWAIPANLVVIGLIVRRTAATGPRASSSPGMPPWDIPLRMAASTSLLLAVTGLAHGIGPHWSGMLSPMPVVAWPLTVFLHSRCGRAEMVAAVRGNAISALGVIAFYVVLGKSMVRWGVPAAFTLAVAASLAATLLLIAALRAAGPRKAASH